MSMLNDIIIFFSFDLFSGEWCW